jgi:SAM-dependent methyltransferase
MGLGVGTRGRDDPKGAFRPLGIAPRDRYAPPMIDSEYWARYYAVTVDRPPWETVRIAIDRFVAEDTKPSRGRFAVDLGSGAGRDARALLRAGWRVLAIDREQAAVATLGSATPVGHRPRLETRVADLATVSIPTCDLVNASLSLPFLPPDAYWTVWGRISDALPVGGRLATMLFGDRDESAGDPTMTCISPATIRASLASFEVEHWVDLEEDARTALGEPHHFHRIEVVARRVRERAQGLRPVSRNSG